MHPAGAQALAARTHRAQVVRAGKAIAVAVAVAKATRAALLLPEAMVGTLHAGMAVRWRSRCTVLAKTVEAGPVAQVAQALAARQVHLSVIATHPS
jgi:hypothetical protein